MDEDAASMDAAQNKLKVLLVEDSPADADLVLRSLRELDVKVEHTRVACAKTLRQALEAFGPDIILSDFAMPGFSGQEALELVRLHAPDVPFLFVSGTIGEELAIEALQRGAMDYVLKDNLRRLPSAIERALAVVRDRADRRRMEQALHESEERFRSIVENSRDWIWENEWNTRTTYSNRALAQILGYEPADFIGGLAIEHMLPEDREEVQRKLPELMAEGKGWYRWQLRWRHRDGSIRVLESTAVPRRDAEGRIIGYRGVDQDVTERLQQEAKIQQLARFHAVLSALGNVVLRASSPDELLRDACRVAVEQGGFRAAGIGRRKDAGHLQVVARFGDPDVLHVVAPEEPMPLDEGSHYHLHPGIRAFVEKRHVAIHDFTRDEVPIKVRADMARIGIRSEIALPLGSEPWGLLALFSDQIQTYDEEELALLERFTSEIDYAVDFLAKSARLEYLAYHNPVTGLPNRSSFRDQLGILLARDVVVAVLDIHRFAHFNESRGRDFGDALLRLAGQRLLAMAGTGALLAHPEADSFLLAYRASGTEDMEAQRLEGLLDAFEQEGFLVEDELVHVALHGGLALGPAHGRDAESLERNAQAAADEGGKRNLRLKVFSDELLHRAQHRIALERDLRAALEADQFELHYQPKFEASRQRLVGAEALLRWRRPDGVLVSPAEFIPVMEDIGLIVPVGRWVLRTAMEQAMAWRPTHPEFRVAVNVSARELHHARFLEGCHELLSCHGRHPPVDIEITESLLMDDIEHSIRQLDALRELGCHISIDDFGTGYSSLNYLARLPADEIKIDQSFIALLAHSPETMGLVTNIISMAHAMSLRVVAEGVEEEDQAKLLRLLRCDVLQGYLYGRPVPAAEFAERYLQRPAAE